MDWQQFLLKFTANFLMKLIFSSFLKSELISAVWLAGSKTFLSFGKGKFNLF
jgi:hypothetical protein